MDERFEAGLTELILDLILPCNIVTSFLAEFNGDVLRTTAVTLLVSTGVQLFCWVLTKCLYRRFSPGERAVAQYATMCSNGSFLGIPMVEGLWGSQGVVLGNFFVVPQRIMTWTVCVGFFTKDRKQSVLRKFFTTPCMIACFVGVLLMVTQLPLPGFLGRTVQALSSCNTALSMFLIGMLMADLRWRNFLDRKVLYVAAVRLCLIPGAVLLTCWLIGLDPLSTGICVVQAAMPAAGLTAILAAKYHGDVAFASGCVTVTTLLSILTIPLWCLLL